MAHNDKIKDTETHFVIDPTTRSITNGSAGNNIIVQHDHNSERFTFEIPRYVDGHDMSECTEVRVNYRNATSNGLNKTDGVYICNDLAISEEDEDKVTFSWLLSSATTQYIGSLYFSLVFVCLDGVAIAYAWNTGIYKDTVIIESINNSEEVVVDNADAIAVLREELMSELESVDASVTVKTHMGGTQTGIIEETNELNIEAGDGVGATVSDGKVVFGIDEITFPKSLKGKDGADGVSVTHLWNGTELIIQSASGTSSADLKGEPGKDGEDGTEILFFDSEAEMYDSYVPEGSVAMIPSSEEERPVLSVNGVKPNADGNVEIDIPEPESPLPEVTEEDNGKFLMVVDGAIFNGCSAININVFRLWLNGRISTHHNACTCMC